VIGVVCAVCVVLIVEVELLELEVVEMEVMAVVEVVAVMLSGFVVEDDKAYYYVEVGNPLSSIIIHRGRGSMDVHTKGWPHGGREGH
jgi:hypothetical protein